MKRAPVIGAIVVVLSVAAVSFVRGQGAPDRPPGVSASQWIPLNDRLGFVMGPRTETSLVHPGDSLLLTSPVSGYFVIKGEGHWSRIVIAEPLRGPGDAG